MNVRVRWLGEYVASFLLPTGAVQLIPGQEYLLPAASVAGRADFAPVPDSDAPEAKPRTKAAKRDS